MKIFMSIRPKGYTGSIEDVPNKQEVGEYNQDQISETMEKLSQNWKEQHFAKHPHARISQSTSGRSLIIRGTGDNGRWLVAWWV